MLKYLDLFGLKFPMYTIMIIIGSIFASLLYYYEYKKNKSKRLEKLTIILPIIILIGFFGAIIYSKIAHRNDEKSGMAFAGGLLFGIISFVIIYPITVSKNKKDFINDLSLLIAPLIIAHALGRVGCFLAGCCYGKSSDSFLAVEFPNGSFQHTDYGYITKVLPTQLFEAIFLFILFIIIMFFIKKYKASIYLISYSIFRFIIEYYRGDDRGKILPFISPSQILCIIFFIIGIILYKKEKNIIKDYENS